MHRICFRAMKPPWNKMVIVPVLMKFIVWKPINKEATNNYIIISSDMCFVGNVREGVSVDPKDEKEKARQRAQRRVFQVEKRARAKALKQEQGCTFEEQSGGLCG